MSLFARTTAEDVPGPLPPVWRCEACRRVGTATHEATVDSLPMRLCVDPAECRRHWPKEPR